MDNVKVLRSELFDVFRWYWYLGSYMSCFYFMSFCAVVTALLSKKVINCTWMTKKLKRKVLLLRTNFCEKSIQNDKAMLCILHSAARKRVKPDNNLIDYMLYSYCASNNFILQYMKAT